MILQACASEKSIRDTAVAIGALEKTIQSEQNYSLFAPAGKFNITRLPIPGRTRCPESNYSSPNLQLASEVFAHHSYALEQYDKAVGRMRGDVLSGRLDMRTTLITCIITICFEIMHGNYDSAASQLQSGILLLQDWKSRQRDASRHPQGFSSPAPHVVEDFLVQVFGRMEILIMTYYDARPSEKHLELSKEGDEIVQRMPKVFSTLEQAQIYLELILRRLQHFIAIITLIPNNNGICFIPDGQDMAEDMPETAKTYALHLQQGLSHTSVVNADLNKHLLTWKSAFRPLFERSIAPAAELEERRAALLIMCAATTTRVCARCALFGQEIWYDIFLPEFKTIVHLAKQILNLEHQIRLSKDEGVSPKVVFAFDNMGLITPLSIVGLKCREPKLRREAVRLLTTYPRREGVWDSAVTAELIRWVMSLEEEIDPDKEIDINEMPLISEERRVRKTGVTFDLAGRVATMSCIQLEPGTGRWIRRSQEHTW